MRRYSQVQRGQGSYERVQGRWPDDRRNQVQLRSHLAWQEWDELSVFIEGVPHDMTTWDLWQRFATVGRIIYIDIFSTREGKRQGTARIKFSQPPRVHPFWVDPITITAHDGRQQINLRVKVESQKRSFQVQSPTQRKVFYPQQIHVSLDAIKFGFMYDESTMHVMHTVYPQRSVDGFVERSLDWKINLLKQKLEITFPVALQAYRVNNTSETGIDGSTKALEQLNTTHEVYRFAIPFTQLNKIRETDFGSHVAITISLEGPPKVFHQLTNVKITHQSDDWKEQDMWFRAVDIVDSPQRLKLIPVSIDKHHSVIDIGRWTTYQFVLKKQQGEEHIFTKVKNLLHDWNIDIVNDSGMSTASGIVAEFWSIMKPTNHLNSSWDLEYHLPFEVRYQLEVCISQGVFNEHNIGKAFIGQLAEVAHRDASNALHMLEYVAEQGERIFDPISVFTNRDALGFSSPVNIPPYCAYMRKATVTPTSLYLNSPTVETSNRVIRQFSHAGDRFLRVQFTDEKAEGRVHGTVDSNINDEVFTRVFRTLANGIDIGNRHYEFLAFGNSQFRENGAYFFCPTSDLSCAQIRDWMGNFTNIKVPAKYAARLGQCFSTTRAIHSVRPTLIPFEDIERNGHCFTDGVGKISELMAAVIANQLSLGAGVPPPSAYQIRMGGCKGMLVAWKDVKNFDIWIRRSQQKFTATYNGLEIIRWSRHSPATLNRQTIIILSALGVKDEVFNKMLLHQLSSYQRVVEDQSLALEILCKFVDVNHITTMIATMIIDGFMISKDPFVMSILHLWRSWSIKLLKEKAKIIVTDGAFLLGVTDETGILKGHFENSNLSAQEPVAMSSLPEIFLQVPNTGTSNQYSVIEGTCIVGRNPSLHPGDIRIVQAINIPELHHLRDVVVFSQNGERDVPSMCSGGDLDGDDFFVLWDKSLIPAVWGTPPMDYRGPTSQTSEDPVTVPDLMKFFVTYMKNDNLPTIALSHLAQADALENSVFDERCCTLANLHSQAVDYVKTGVPAVLHQKQKPRLWPHFMESRYRAKEKTYHSDKILGQLYDKVDNVKFEPQYKNAFDDRVLTAYPENKDLLRAARQLKTRYDTAMLRIMAQHDIQTEFEVWTTFVMSKPRVGSDYKVQEEMGTISEALKARFRTSVFDLAGNKTFDAVAPVVAAMYCVTQEEMQIALQECASTILLGGREFPKRKMIPRFMPLISFPWLFPEYLSRIATGSRKEIDILGLPTRQAGSARHFIPNIIDDQSEDIVKTGQGVVHRGEDLDLFSPQDMDDDEDHVQRFDDSIDLGGSELTDESSYLSARSVLSGPENGESTDTVLIDIGPVFSPAERLGNLTNGDR